MQRTVRRLYHRLARSGKRSSCLRLLPLPQVVWVYHSTRNVLRLMPATTRRWGGTNLSTCRGSTRTTRKKYWPATTRGLARLIGRFLNTAQTGLRTCRRKRRLTSLTSCVRLGLAHPLQWEKAGSPEHTTSLRTMLRCQIVNAMRGLRISRSRSINLKLHPLAPGQTYRIESRTLQARWQTDARTYLSRLLSKSANTSPHRKVLSYRPVSIRRALTGSSARS